MRLDVSSAKLLKEIDNFIDSHIWEWEVVPNNLSTTTIGDYGYNMYLHAPQTITTTNYIATTATTDVGFYYDSIRQAVQPMITQDLRQ